MSQVAGSLPVASGNTDANNNPKRLIQDALAPTPVSAEDKAVNAVESVLDGLTPSQVDAIAERGAKAAARDIVATRDEYVVDQLEKLGAASVKRAARRAVADYFKAHCARRVSGR